MEDGADNLYRTALDQGQLDGYLEFKHKGKKYVRAVREYYELGYRLGAAQRLGSQFLIEEHITTFMSFLSLLGVAGALFGVTWNGPIGIGIIMLIGLSNLNILVRRQIAVERRRSESLKEKWAHPLLGRVKSLAEAQALIEGVEIKIIGRRDLSPLGLQERLYLRKHGWTQALAVFIPLIFSVEVLFRYATNREAFLYNLLGRGWLGW